MEGIYEPNDNFDFNKLTLIKPVVITGGNYFIKLITQNNPVYIQPPKCSLKQSITKSGKKWFADLMFSNDNDQFIRWMENLENYIQKYIYNNRSQWFDGDLEMTDIENYFTPTMKIYKSGKYYIIRTNISSVLGKSVLKIYDENEKEVDMESLNENRNIMTILELQGIKCSPRSFQLEIELKQMLVMNPVNMFDKCLLIKKQNEPTHLPSQLPPQSYGVPKYDTTLDEVEESKMDGAVAESKYNEGEIGVTNEPVTVTIPTEDETLIEEECEDGREEEQIENQTEQVEENQTLEKETLENKKDNDLEEIDFEIEKLSETETIQIKQRNEVYYEMYREARRKAKIARNLALSSYLEAKRIKNTYMLEDIKDSDDSDLDADLEEDLEGDLEQLENN